MEINIIDNNCGYTSVEIRKPKAGDAVKAQNISGQIEGFGFLAALLSLVATFDGQKLIYEEVLEKVDLDIFLEVSPKLLGVIPKL